MQEYLDLLKKTREHLMTGVSYMVPVILAGAIPIALALIIGGQNVEGAVAQFFMSVGGVGMGLFVAVMAAYIAYAVAGRAAIAPGLICGMIASNEGTGFLGGIVIGLVVGYVTYTLRKIKLQRTLMPIMTLIVYPLVATLVGATIMVFVIAKPVAAAMGGLTAWLSGLSEAGAVVLGLVLGAMIGFDFGGPVNKVAYTFGVGLLGSEVFAPMGMIGPAISVAPIGMALASFIAPKLYSEEEIEAGRAALVLGLVTISEGAIPFAVVDPIRVIVCSVIGSAIAGGIAGGLGVLNRAPLGGVLILPVVTNIIGYLIALAVGSVVMAFLINFWKRMGKRGKVVSEEGPVAGEAM
jgi:fructose-specific phosphotransferase system IIC component